MLGCTAGSARGAAVPPAASAVAATKEGCSAETRVIAAVAGTGLANTCLRPHVGI